MNITILGAGAFGTALGHILTSNGHTVQYFDPYKFPDITLDGALHFSSPSHPPASITNQAAATPSTRTRTKVVILAAPSAAATDLLLRLPSDLHLICATKGFLSLTPFTRFREFSIISGPAFAAQLDSHIPVTLTATSLLIPTLFQTSWLEFDGTMDDLGVFLCGSLKNIYAIGAGLRQLTPENLTLHHTTHIKKAPSPQTSQGSSPHATPAQKSSSPHTTSIQKATPIPSLYHTFAKKSSENSKNPPKSTKIHQNSPKNHLSTYINSAHKELKLILAANSCTPSTADLACGIGDLTLTCSSPTSRNYQYGLSLARQVSSAPPVPPPTHIASSDSSLNPSTPPESPSALTSASSSTSQNISSSIASSESPITSPEPSAPTTVEGLSTLQILDRFIAIPSECHILRSIQLAVNNTSTPPAPSTHPSASSAITRPTSNPLRSI